MLKCKSVFVVAACYSALTENGKQCLKESKKNNQIPIYSSHFLTKTGQNTRARPVAAHPVVITAVSTC